MYSHGMETENQFHRLGSIGKVNPDVVGRYVILRKKCVGLTRNHTISFEINIIIDS